MNGWSRWVTAPSGRSGRCRPCPSARATASDRPVGEEPVGADRRTPRPGSPSSASIGARLRPAPSSAVRAVERVQVPPARSRPRRRAGRRRAPGRLDDGDPRAAGDRPRLAERRHRAATSATRSRVASHGMSGRSHSIQASGVPSGEGRGAATKSGPATRTRPGAVGPVERDRDQLVDDQQRVVLARRVVRLAHGVQPLARGVERAGRRSATGRPGVIATGSATRLRVEPVQPPVGGVRRDDPPAVHHVRGAAVLVDAVAHVERGRRELARRAVGPVAEQRPPAALGRPALEPVDVVAVDRRLGEADRRGRDQLDVDRRRPAAVRRDDRGRRGLRRSGAASSSVIAV